ncbi:MAG: DsrE family protein [Bacteroidales bacterium]|nr:DsrE family protein [Bacteroidales bacterium]
MDTKDHLYVLWTSSEKATFDEMVYMYTLNGMKRQWWSEITLIIWGASAELVGTNPEVQQKLKELAAAGVHLTACKACADNLSVSGIFEKDHIELKYWGTPLTELLRSDAKMITI